MQRTKDRRGDLDVLDGNFINLSVPPGLTHFDHLIAISKSSGRPFPIKFLTEKLKEQRFLRGCIYSGAVGREIENMLISYPFLRWWIEETGLVVDEARPESGPLSDFDRVAGPIVIEQMSAGKLSASSLAMIANTLDANGLQLKENLQPAQWKKISDYNQKYSRLAIRTFVQTIDRPQFARSVRRRLYLARDRYQKALKPPEPIFVEG